MKHAWWIVRCKSPKCGIILVSYIGVHDGRPMYVLPTEGPGWWEYECGECGKLHRYTRNDLELQSLDFPPEPGFRSWF